eukprot:Gb_20313 [translate_table: standard]
MEMHIPDAEDLQWVAQQQEENLYIPDEDEEYFEHIPPPSMSNDEDLPFSTQNVGCRKRAFRYAKLNPTYFLSSQFSKNMSDVARATKGLLCQLNKKQACDGRLEEKILLLCGPPGLGKTALAHVPAKHYVQMNSVIVDSKPKCLVIDEIDGALGEGKGNPCSRTGSGNEVLLHGFNWETHRSRRWYCDLSEKATEIASCGFTIVWLPLPTDSVSPEGYMPCDLHNINSDDEVDTEEASSLGQEDTSASNVILAWAKANNHDSL